MQVGPLPDWLPLDRFLGEHPWEVVDDDEGRTARALLDRREAADLAARLRGIGVAGRPLQVVVQPALPRPWVRAARTDDARRRRDTTPGFTDGRARLDEEGRRSLTPEVLALALGQRVAGSQVVDATCGAGGNTIGFARAGCAVTAIEQDPDRLALARHNARLYGVEDRVRWIAGDARAVLPDLEGDVLFVDPPWGDWDRTGCRIADLPLLAELLDHAPRFPRWMAKVPPSFDPAGCPGARAEAWFGEAAGDRQRIKLVLLDSRG